MKEDRNSTRPHLPSTGGDDNYSLRQTPVRRLDSGDGRGEGGVGGDWQYALEVVEDLSMEHGGLGLTAYVGHRLHSLHRVVTLGRLP